jgi:hypothetical protein
MSLQISTRARAGVATGHDVGVDVADVQPLVDLHATGW